MAEVSTSSRPLPPHLRQAQPGDGAFLATSSTPQPQPGDGAYLAHQSRQNRPNGSVPRRDGSASRVGQGVNHNAHRAPQQWGLDRAGVDDRATWSTGGKPAAGIGARGPQRSPANGDNSINGGASSHMPIRPRQPRQRARNSASSAQGSIGKTLASVKVPQLQSLDPAAPTFTPGAALLASDLDRTGEETPPSMDEGSKKGKKRNAKRNEKKKGNGAEDGAARTGAEDLPKPPKPVAGRRAAFEQSTKLTHTLSRTSSDGVASKEQAKKVDQREKTKKDEPDDLVSKLTRGLKNRPFLECPICFNAITPSQPVWSCLPPDHPPEPSTSADLTLNPITGSTASSNHYSACYTPFHMDCIRDWANRSLTEEQDRARQAGREGEEIAWRCPGCQKRRADRVAGYRCFCGRLSHPPTLTTAPHSCGDSCARKRPKCSHPCPLPCHPGPCPPCQVALVVPCPSHHTPSTVKCSAATSNNAAMSPVCDELCSRPLHCGNADHNCQDLCHCGACKPCDQREIARCYCGEDEKDVECGWGRKSEKICARLGDNGEKETWWGKYDCGKACERLFECGIHPCKETCHPHPIHPLTCPRSPTAVTHCPCGTTPLSELPDYPRSDCLAPIPTCSSPCPKTRPCGHLCPRKCHAGDCPPCHEEVIRACRCGQSQFLVPCDELRERMENGQGEVTCERICKALRNCGRHECGRMCCPLWEQAKMKNKKQRNDDHDLFFHDDLHKCHLTCGRTLSCGLHTCPKPDHKGPCGRCLQASYDELICQCGHTIVYPPVACGTTINCPYPCARPPPACGHPKTPHSCHESSDCPPCPYLTTKSCACGKDPSVKNVRCSQDRVSCGQPCGELLGCGYHKCNKLCHRPGDCESCSQVCGKPKRICKHPCTAICHAPAKCPESDPCQAIVTQSCACGNLQQRTSCGASSGNPRSREIEQLKCNSECAVRQRNARLADALGIKASERGQETYEEELKAFAAGNYGFVKMVEGTFEDFFKGTKQSMVLPHMPAAKRSFVMALAEHYRLTRELIDQEPNRSVQIRRRVDTRIPVPLLSAGVQPTIVQPQAGPSRLLTSLAGSGGGWGRGASSGKGLTAAGIVASSSTTSSPNLGSGAGWGTGSARPSRVPTPVAPVLSERSGPATSTKESGDGTKVTQGGDDDWDVDL
ncbi:hypothetical protein IAR55_005556 [Kwoniella newhampshirensis]|uniref:NF-X1-type domain-containing protein n=1 Tax=Kwoniella newhampshirensis TaxID=1651941 RepID=A0AAW0YHN9_9TREE